MLKIFPVRRANNASQYAIDEGLQAARTHQHGKVDALRKHLRNTQAIRFWHAQERFADLGENHVFLTDSSVTVFVLSLMLTGLQRASALLLRPNHAVVLIFTTRYAIYFVATFRSTLAYPIHAPTPRHLA